MILISLLLSAFVLTYVFIKALLFRKINFNLIAAPNKDVITHTKPIPIFGGLIIQSVSLLIIVCVTDLIDISLTNFFLGIIPISLLGYYKDSIQRPFSPYIQFIIQGISTYFLYNHWSQLNSIQFDWMIMVVFILGCNLLLNAFNFLDVMDGLASGYSLIVFAILGGLAFIIGQKGITFIALIYLGANAAFLTYNWNPAKLFLGDIGSFNLMYAILFILITLFPFNSALDLIPIMCFLFVPIFEFIYTVIRRLIKNKLPHRGDANHLSLVLLNKGWKSKRIVLYVAAITVVTNIIGLILIR